jgi:glutamate racemase
MAQPADHPIGMFDSGVGGLSVLREVRVELPFEDLVYVADSAHAPYGDKPAPYIERRALAVSRFLIGQGVKALVVACNTATGVAVETLRRQFTLPIVGIEPAIKPAVALTRSGIVGVLATSQTLASQKFETLVGAVRGNARILTQPCPGLVEQIEEGTSSSPATRLLIEQYVAPLLARGADTLVLGCTHYPLVADVIRAVAGPDVHVIDPARAVAKEVRRRLGEAGLRHDRARTGTLRFFTNGDVNRFREFLAGAAFADFELRQLDTEV